MVGEKVFVRRAVLASEGLEGGGDAGRRCGSIGGDAEENNAI